MPKIATANSQHYTTETPPKHKKMTLKISEIQEKFAFFADF